MKKYFFIILILLSSCAVRYKKIEPELARYEKTDTTQIVNVHFSQSNILLESGNKRMSQKALRKKLRIVPIFIENKSNDTLSISKYNFEIFSNFESVEVLDYNQYIPKLKQHPASYIPGALLGAYVGVQIFFTVYVNSQIKPISVLLASLLPMSIYDFMVSKTANNRMIKDIYAIDICNKKIIPHSQAYGIICVKTSSTEPLIYRFKKR